MNDEQPRGSGEPYAPPTYGSGFGIAPYQMGSGGYGPIVPRPEDEQPLATRGARFGARLIDGLLLLLCMTPGLVFVFTSKSYDEPPWVAFAMMAVGALAVSAYQWWRITERGQTVGKSALHIKVVKQDGSPVGFVDGVLIREWAISFLGFIPIVGRFLTFVDAVMIFGAEQRCLHDAMAKTKVVAVMPTIPE